MVRRLQTEKIDVFFFLEILTHTAVGLIEEGLLFPGKILVCAWNMLYLEINGIYTNDHSPDVPIIPTF